MKVEITPTENILTTMPIMLKIMEEKSPPSVEVKGLGAAPVRKEKNYYISEFWAQKEGHYQVIVRGEEAIWKTMVHIEAQKYVTFNQEMTIFGGLLIFASIGLILWMKKIKKI